MSIRTVGLAVIALGLTLAGLLWTRWQPSGGSGTSEPETCPTDAPVERGPLDVRGHAAPPQVEASAAATTTASDGPSTTDARTALQVPLLSGRVLDPDGAPVGGALLSWTAVPFVSWETPVAQWAFDREGLESRTVRTRSGSDGAFAFGEAPSGVSEEGTALWATHPDFEAGGLAFLGLEMPPGPHTVTLSPHAAMRLRVVDEQGRGVAGALVEHVAVPPDSARIGRQITLEERMRCVLFRTYETDASGVALLPAMPDRQSVRAESGSSVTPRWVGEAREDLELSLGASFTAQGRVHLAGEGDLEGELRITIAELAGSVQRTLAVVPVDEDSFVWGPVQVPLPGTARIEVRVDGGRAVPARVLRAAPAAGELLHVDLETNLGHDLWFMLLGENEEPLLAAEALVYWRDSQGEASSTGRANLGGYVRVRGLPEGVVTAFGRSPGYVVVPFGPITIPEEQVVTHTLAAYRGGRIEGRCLADGRPVQDFEVLYWPSGYTAGVNRVAFEGREDGSFVIEDAPLGPTSISASSDDRPQSGIAQVEVSQTRSAQVVLDLPEPQVARGRVVDDSGEPVDDAWIQLQSGFRSQFFAPWGTPIAVARDGTFEIHGLSPGTSFFEVSCAGFSTRKVGAEVTAGQVLDLGTIRLFPRQTLEVRLRVGRDMDPSAYEVGGSVGDARLPLKRFDPDGVASFEEVDAGQYALLVWLSDSELQETLVNLRPGEPWVVEVDLSRSADITVRVEPSSSSALGAERRLYIQYRDPQSRLVSRVVVWEPDEEKTVRDLLPGEVTIQVRADERTLASRTVDLVAGENRLVEIPLSGIDGHVRVVDGSGRGIVGVQVQFYDDGTLRRAEYTDANGLATLQNAPEEPLLVGLLHDTAGTRWGIPIEFGGHPDEVVELELDPRASLAFQVLDGQTPAEGVSCQLREPLHLIPATVSTATDAEGRVSWTRLAEGEYVLIFFHEAYWPVEVPLTLQGESPPRTFQIRRRGDLTFEVRSPSGAPVQGVAPTVTSLEFEESVATWLASAAIVASPANARTGANGRLTFQGVPHGAYAWGVTLPGGEVLSGTVEVAPAGNTLVVVAWQ